MQHQEQIYGCLMGIAVGDAVGLPLENLSRSRINRWLKDGPIKHRLILRMGLVSDDTEHSCLVGQSLIQSKEDPDLFGRDLAKRLKWWLAGLPAGTGRATAKACLKLWLGWNYQNAGMWSAGNGPPMRAPIIGVAVKDWRRAVELVQISSRITHSDPKATYGALAVAAVAHQVTYDPGNHPLDPDTVFNICRKWIQSTTQDESAAELTSLIALAVESVKQGETTREFAERNGMGKGVSGYTYHTVPAALHSCMRYPNDFRAALEELIRCGGDVDSTAAIAGGILGARLGSDSLPKDWVDGLIEWPRTKSWMSRLSDALAQSSKGEALTTKMPTINPLFDAKYSVLVCRFASRTTPVVTTVTLR